MPLKTVYCEALERTVKFGRRAPVSRGFAPLFSRYAANLPAPPANANYATVPTMTALRNIYGNDTLGDCVIAGGYHDVGLWTGNANGLFVATDAQIIADYSAIGGYVPGNPNTDQGCDEETALNYWVQHGFANGTKLAGWLRVDATNQTQVQQALWLFESVYFGINLPDKWVNPMPSADGFTWDVAGKADPANGHCVVGCAYNATGVLIDTWGLLGTVTWGAVKKYAAAASNGELYLLLSPDSIAKATAKAPNGFDWPTLISDFNAMGGNLPVPDPNPPNPTPPTPTPPTPTPPVPTPPAPTATGTCTVTLSGITYTGTLAATAKGESDPVDIDDELAEHDAIDAVMAEFPTS